MTDPELAALGRTSLAQDSAGLPRVAGKPLAGWGGRLMPQHLWRDLSLLRFCEVCFARQLARVATGSRTSVRSVRAIPTMMGGGNRGAGRMHRQEMGRRHASWNWHDRVC
jgi:hypothetical protein